MACYRKRQGPRNQFLTLLGEDMALPADHALQSTLGSLEPGAVEPTRERLAEERARSQGLEVVSCPTCGASATRETCHVWRAGQALSRQTIRCLRNRGHVTAHETEEG